MKQTAHDLAQLWRTVPHMDYKFSGGWNPSVQPYVSGEVRASDSIHLELDLTPDLAAVVLSALAAAAEQSATTLAADSISQT